MKDLLIIICLFIFSNCLPNTKRQKDLDNNSLKITGDLDFGDVCINNTQTIGYLLTNNTNNEIEIDVLASKNSFTNKAFSFKEEDFTGHKNGFCKNVLSPKEKCGVSILFTPNAKALFSTELEFFYSVNEVKKTNVLKLTGSGVAGSLSFDRSPSTNFGNVVTGENVVRSFKIWNSSHMNVTIDSIVPPSGPFSVYPSATNCSTGALITSNYCIYKISFSPQEARNYASKIIFNYDGGERLEKNIYGVGVSPTSSSYEIADDGPAGGKVFISPDTEGNNTNKYFEVAQADVFCTDGSSSWGCVGISTGATNYGYGGGLVNNQIMVDTYDLCQNACNASSLCRNLTLNGFNDWFLPSAGEFSQIYFQRNNGIGTYVTTDKYWTSTEQSQNEAKAWNFQNGAPSFTLKVETQHHVRCVRSFY